MCMTSPNNFLSIVIFNQSCHSFLRRHLPFVAKAKYSFGVIITKLSQTSTKSTFSDSYKRTWFYPTDQGRPHLEYQAMSTIKGIPKHNRGSILKFGKKGRLLEIQIDNSENSKCSARKRRERKNKIES